VSSRHAQQEYVAPRTAVEERVASIWAEVLGVDRIGVFDNFFDLGGHSLLLTRVGVRLSKSFNKNVSIIEMFKYPTISSIAEFITTELNQGISLQKAQSRSMKQKEAFKRRRDRANERSKASG
jgi:acyl carrier protein